MNQCFLICALAALLGLVWPGQLTAQEPVIDATWEHRIPNLNIWRTKGGSFLHDAVRGRVFYYGGADQTFYTDDAGRSWHAIYNPVWDVLGSTNTFFIDDVGRYYFSGQTYYRAWRTMVSLDGGATWRKMEPDTAVAEAARTEIALAKRVGPAVGWFYAISTKQIFTVDGGATWRTTAYGADTSADALNILGQEVISPEPGVIARRAVDDPANTFRELDLATDQIRPAVGLPAVRDYRRLRGGSIFAWRDLVFDIDFSWFRPTTGTWGHFPIRDRWPDLSYSGRQPAQFHRIGDSAAVMLLFGGKLVRYDAGADSLRVVFDPVLEPRQRVVSYGYNNGTLAFTLVRPTAALHEQVLFVTYDATSDALDVVSGNGVTLTEPAWSGEGTLFPVSARHLFYAIPGSLGEVMESFDAGRTWQHIMTFQRAARLEIEFHDVHSVLPTSDGRVVTRVAGGRILAEPVDRDTVWPAVMLYPGTVTYSASVATVLSGRLEHRYGMASVALTAGDTVVSCGNAVTRWTRDGGFVDTILDRRATYFRELPSGRYVAGMDTTWMSFNKGDDWLAVNLTIPHHDDTTRAAIGAVTELPDETLLLGLRGIRRQQVTTDGTTGDDGVRDSIIGGLWRSDDRGATWTPSADGMGTNGYVMAIERHPRTGTLFAAAADVVDAPVFGTDQGVEQKYSYVMKNWTLFRSTDDGRSWVPCVVLGSLGDRPTSACTIAFGPYGDVNVALPRRQLLRSFDDGIVWTVPETRGLDTAVILDMAYARDGRLLMGTTKGLASVVLPANGVAETGDLSRSFALGDGRWTVELVDMAGRAVAVRTLDGPLDDARAAIAGQVPGLSQGVYGFSASNGTSVLRTVLSMPPYPRR